MQQMEGLVNRLLAKSLAEHPDRQARPVTAFQNIADDKYKIFLSNVLIFQTKKFVSIFHNTKTCFFPKFNFGVKHVFGFLRIKCFEVLLDFLRRVGFAKKPIELSL